MMEIFQGNYYDIAVSDLYFAKIGIDSILESGIGGYNNCAASCTQAVEKFLKHLFITFGLPFEPAFIPGADIYRGLRGTCMRTG
jgi:hypothetical protein